MSIHSLRQTARRSSAPAFNVLTDIPWANAYWAEGPNMAALALSSGANVTTWPDEVGSAAMVPTTVALPTYSTTVANGRPAVVAAGTTQMSVTTTTLNQPWTVVVVGRRTGGNTSAAYAGSQGNANANAGLTRSNFLVGATLTFGGPSFDGRSLFIAEANSTSSEVTIDNTSIVVGDAGTSTLPRRTAFGRANGATATAPLTGDLSFVGFIGRALTSGEKSALHTWSQGLYATA